jgi:hypothetical protein
MSLKKIKQDLADQHVAAGAGDVSPQVFKAPNLPNALETYHLPCRMLLSGDEEGLTGEGRFVALGKLTAVTFQISDLLFWQPLAQGIGRSDVEANLVSYLDNYLAMLRSWRDAGQQQAHVVSFQADIARLEYPRDSGRWFWGVPCVVRVEEFYSGA